MVRTIWGDPKRFEEQYWSRFPGAYFTGDAARRDEDGYFWVLGRVDDVMNVSGHRLSTMEVESALVHHPAVAEAAVVGKPHEITGQAVCAFVTLKNGDWDRRRTWQRNYGNGWRNEIGGFARPGRDPLHRLLPKTRSGKIMRRLLREIVTNNAVTGDVTTLEDLSVRHQTRLAARRGLVGGTCNCMVRNLGDTSVPEHGKWCCGTGGAPILPPLCRTADDSQDQLAKVNTRRSGSMKPPCAQVPNRS